MARKFNYRGRAPEDLRKMTMEEVTPLLTSRARRYIKRGNKRYRVLVETVKKVSAAGGQKMIKTHIREGLILPEWIGLTFGIHNGKEFKKVEITPEKIGKRLGEYAHTTGPVKHSGPGVGATRGSKFIPLK
ncbi:30S ribosomal protein S19 [uncultured archaeon]|nr:30S ribosomal protein S19 [uncultured archaeon]